MDGDPVYLLSVVRSGTTYLGYALKNHPAVARFGEIFFPSLEDPLITYFGWYHWLQARVAEDGRALFPDVQRDLFPRYLAFLQDQEPGKRAIVDVKLEQLSWATPALQQAIFRPESDFIILWRRNLLKLVVSSALMFERIRRGDGEVHRDYVPEKLAMWLDPQWVIGEIRGKQALMNTYAGRAQRVGGRCLEIFYEDLVDPALGRAQLEAVQSFLGVEPLDLQAGLAKQNPYPVSDLIENYDEVAAALRDNELGYLIDLPS